MSSEESDIKSEDGTSPDKEESAKTEETPPPSKGDTKDLKEPSS